MRFLPLLFITLFAFAADITPFKEIETSGNVLDIVIKNDKLYAGTDGGTLEIYDIQKETFINKITLDKIHDFMGDLMPRKVYSVDEHHGKLLLLAEAEHGERELFISENNQTKKVIAGEAKLLMNKAKFIDDNSIFLGLLSNEIVLYDLTKGVQYKKQLSQSKFSDFALNEDKTKAVIACESGINYLVNVADGSLVKELKGINKDNVFKVAFKNGKVATAGQDRIGGLYDVDTGATKNFEAPFLVYATGLNKDAGMVAYAFGIDNEIALFNTSTGSKRYMLKGQKSTLNTIKFYDDNTLFSGSDDKYIQMWKLN